MILFFAYIAPTHPNQQLQWSNYRIVTGKNCTTYFPNIPSNLLMCARRTNQNIPTYPGYGDAGGALVWTLNNQQFLLGIFSFSRGIDDLFNGGYVGFINIPIHARWITRLVASIPRP